MDLTIEEANKEQEFKSRARDDIGELFKGMSLAEASSEVADHAWQVSSSLIYLSASMLLAS